jgi:hypothetical protein
MTPEQKREIGTALQRTIAVCEAWERHLRNPAKYPKPLNSIAAAIIRLERWQSILDTMPSERPDTDRT